MIWSVSMFVSGSTAVRERMLLIGCIRYVLNEVAGIGDLATDRRRGGREGAGQQCACANALTTFEVAVAGAHRVLAGAHKVAIHPEAHGAAALAPLGTRVDEYTIETLSLR